MALLIKVLLIKKVCICLYDISLVNGLKTFYIDIKAIERVKKANYVLKRDGKLQGQITLKPQGLTL